MYCWYCQRQMPHMGALLLHECCPAERVRPAQFRVPTCRTEVATNGHGVMALPSSFGAEAGFGVYASRAFFKNEYVTFYAGEEIGRAEALRRQKLGRQSHIRALIIGHVYIDGIRGADAQLGDGLASVINHAHPFNVAFAEFPTMCPPVMYVRALRDIAAGEELSITYAQTYWR